jgi:hypothetical protein
VRGRTGCEFILSSTRRWCRTCFLHRTSSLIYRSVRLEKSLSRGSGRGFASYVRPPMMVSDASRETSPLGWSAGEHAERGQARVAQASIRQCTQNICDARARNRRIGFAVRRSGNGRRDFLGAHAAARLDSHRAPKEVTARPPCPRRCGRSLKAASSPDRRCARFMTNAADWNAMKVGPELKP